MVKGGVNRASVVEGWCCGAIVPRSRVPSSGAVLRRRMGAMRAWRTGHTPLEARERVVSLSALSALGLLLSDY